MATPVLQFKRGAFSNLPALKAGEPGFTTDKFDLFIGLDNILANNKFVGSHRYWTQETASSGSGVNLVENTSGTDFITLAAPSSLSGVTTYTFPGTPTDGGFLKTNSTGGLSWSTAITGASLTDTVLSGVTTIANTNLDVNAAAVDFSGIVTFSNTTQSTNKDTGAVVVEGGVGIEKNLSVGGATTITGNLFVGGESEFIGVVTFRGGTINLGDSDTDDVVIGGEFASNLVPTTNNAFDLGAAGKAWRHANFAGVGTFATGAVADAIQIGITGASEIDTSSGNLTLDSAAGTVIVDDQLSVTGVSTFTGAIDANGGATIDNIQIGVTDNNEIDTSTGGLTLDSSSGQTTIDDNLSVTGVSTFTGATTFTGVIDANGGATIDNIQIGITDNNEIDTSTGGLTLDSASGQTTIDDNLSVAGVSTFTGATTFTGAIDANGSATIDNIQIGVSDDNEIDTSSGGLTLDSASGQTTIDDNLSVTGVSTFTGNVTANGDITVTTGNTLTVSDLTQFDVLVAGASGAVNDSGGALTFNSNVLTVNNTIDVTSIEVTNVKAKDGTTSITITDSNGHVGVASDLTVSGKLIVLGSQTEVNTETLLVEDSLIEIGLVNSGGSLVAPSSDANIDVGVVFHYFDTAARKASVFWDDSAARVAFASSVTESSSVFTQIAYAEVEFGKLFINDGGGSPMGAGTTVLFHDASRSSIVLENTLIDCGSF